MPGGAFCCGRSDRRHLDSACPQLPVAIAAVLPAVGLWSVLGEPIHFLYGPFGEARAELFGEPWADDEAGCDALITDHAHDCTSVDVRLVLAAEVDLFERPAHL